MNKGTSTDNFDIEQLRTRLRKMSDTELIEFGKNLRYLCSPEANFGTPPLEVWAMQLRERREEWRTKTVQFRLPPSKTLVLIGDFVGGAGGNRTIGEVEDAQVIDSTKRQIREKPEKP